MPYILYSCALYVCGTLSHCGEKDVHCYQKSTGARNSNAMFLIEHKKKTSTFNFHLLL
jgi:hypothetical protein